MNCSYGTCRVECGRVLFVTHVGAFPTCGKHGRKMIKVLMVLYPGKAIYSRGRNI